jgi:sec-independent protein translocase protein TatC
MTDAITHDSVAAAAHTIAIAIAAIVTPTPDLVTMLTVSFPLFLLYELSIYVSARVASNKKKAEIEFYKD